LNTPNISLEVEILRPDSDELSNMLSSSRDA
jgi:hypothetical protein